VSRLKCSPTARTRRAAMIVILTSAAASVRSQGFQP
jgi:hypothetical protein